MYIFSRFSLVVVLIVLSVSCSTESIQTYSLTTTVSPEEAGTITPFSGTFEKGEIISLRANPLQGWIFERWEQDLTTTANPVNVTFNRDYTIIAVFERLTHPLTINIVGQGSVIKTVTPSRTVEYSEGTIISLMAEPEIGWIFSHWDGDLTGSQNPETITVDKPISVNTYFITLPTVVTKEAESITDISAVVGGRIIDDGGDEITERGICWSTNRSPDRDDQCNNEGAGAGDYISNLIDLSPDTQYYVRAYALNNVGIAFGEEVEFRTTARTDWPRDDETIIEDVLNPVTGRIWMDRNLGASRRAVTSTDSMAYGDLYQWGRSSDGHQDRKSTTTFELSSTDWPGHDLFILNDKTANFDWRNPASDDLWQGLNGMNNPCPVGYRIPTDSEWEAERQSWLSTNSSGAFSSPLNLTNAGYRSSTSGELVVVGEYGRYWSSTVDGIRARLLNFTETYATMSSYGRANGRSVRCIKD